MSTTEKKANIDRAFVALIAVAGSATAHSGYCSRQRETRRWVNHRSVQKLRQPDLRCC